MKLNEILNETAMPPKDMRQWLIDTLLDAEEHGDIDFQDDPKVTPKMVDAFDTLIDKIPEDGNREDTDDAVYDAALEVYHQFVGPVASKEKQKNSKV